MSMSDRKAREIVIRSEVVDAAHEIAEEEVGRNEPHDRIFEATDTIFARQVKAKKVSDYDVSDMLQTLGACAAILAVAEEDAWIEDDAGLWEGCEPYGVLASIAFFSLEHCIWQKLDDMDVTE